MGKYILIKKNKFENFKKYKKKKKDFRLYMKKLQKGKIKTFETSKKKLTLIFGTAGLRALTAGRVFPFQYETLRRVLFKKANRKLRFWNRSTFSFFLTKKPISIRMGRGKGEISCITARITAGAILFEFTGLNEYKLNEIKKTLLNKLYIKYELIFRQNYL